MGKKILIISICFQIIFSFCNCNNKYKNIQISYGIFSNPFSLDPSKINNKVTCNIFPNIFETLITLDNNKSNINPKLASKWEITNDGLQYIFYLIPKIQFHDGSTLNANDVKVSFLRQYDKNSYYYNNEPPNIFENILKNTIKSITVIDNLTVKFDLYYPNYLFLYLLSSPYIASIISSKSLEKYGVNIGEHPIGTGQFKLLLRNEDIILSSFKQYWKERINIESLIFKTGRPNELEVKALENSIDVLNRISGSNIDKFKNSNKFNFFSIEPETIYFLGFNLKRKLLRNKYIRKAILLSLDRNKIVNTLNRTNAIVADGPLPIGIFHSDNMEKQEKYNLGRAEELIKNSNYNGTKIKLLVFEDSPRTTVFFDIIVNQISQTGLKIEKDFYNDWEDFEEAKREGAYDLILDGWAADILGDPYFFLYNLFHSESNFNVFNYKNERVDALLDEAVRTFDKEKRNVMYEEINNIVIEDIPAVFISQIKDVFVVNKRIKNVKINPYRYIEYQNVTVE
ncbi:ABC transporter substrate-binding protein [candidate division KSB1 bacterium]